MDRLSRLFGSSAEGSSSSSSFPEGTSRRVVTAEELTCEARRLSIGARWARSCGANTSLEPRGRACDRRCAALAAARRVAFSQGSIAELVAQREPAEQARAVGRVVCDVACDGSECCCVAPRRQRLGVPSILIAGPMGDGAEEVRSSTSSVEAVVNHTSTTLGNSTTPESLPPPPPPRTYSGASSVVSSSRVLSADSLDDAAACAAVLLLFAPERVAVALLRELAARGALFQRHRLFSGSRAVARLVAAAYPSLAEHHLLMAVEAIAPRLLRRALVDAVPLAALVVAWDDWFESSRKDLPPKQRGRSAPPATHRAPSMRPRSATEGDLSSSSEVIFSDDDDDERPRRRRRLLEGESPLSSHRRRARLSRDASAAIFARIAAALVGCCREVAACAVARAATTPEAVFAAVSTDLIGDADASKLAAELDALDDDLDGATAALAAAGEELRASAMDDDPLAPAVERGAARASRAALDDLAKAGVDRLDVRAVPPPLERAVAVVAKEDTVPVSLVRAAAALVASDAPPRACLAACVDACADDGCLSPRMAAAAARLLAAVAPGCRLARKAEALRRADGILEAAAFVDAALSDLAVSRHLYGLALLDPSRARDDLMLMECGATARAPSDLSHDHHGLLSSCASRPAPPSRFHDRPNPDVDTTCFFCRTSIPNDKLSTAAAAAAAAAASPRGPLLATQGCLLM